MRRVREGVPGRDIFVLAVGLLGNPEDAQDVTQDVLIALFRNIFLETTADNYIYADDKNQKDKFKDLLDFLNWMSAYQASLDVSVETVKGLARFFHGGGWKPFDNIEEGIEEFEELFEIDIIELMEDFCRPEDECKYFEC